jgi:O-glycosyl hydrolase
LATDTSGQSTTSAAVTVTVSNGVSGPTVTITSPTNGSTVSSTVTVSANASSGSPITSVQFKLDGANLGPALTTAPYTYSWDTTKVANGSHSLTAVATDSSGNTGTSSTVTVTVSNGGGSGSPVPSGLVAAYAFSEGSGTTVTDLSGNGNTGTISNATWTTTGKYGNALSFNGTNALVSINDSPSLDLTKGMTLEAWVNPTAVPPFWSAAIVKEQHSDPANDLSYALYTADGGGKPPAVHGLFGSGSGADQYATGGGVLALNTWTYLAGTYDGTALRLYVNGTLVATRTASGLLTTTSDPLRLGGDFDKEYFTGVLDEIRVYNRALSQSEIQTDMATPLSAATPIVSLTNPGPGTTVSGTITVSAGAYANAGITKVQFKLDGANLGPALSAGPYTYSWNTSTVANGNHTLTAVATDANGNSTTSAPVTVTVSNGVSGPSVSITSPTNGATVSSTITVSANASSSVGISSVQFKLDGANLGPALTTSPYTYSWNTTTVGNGSHTLTAVATDTNGISTTSAGVTVSVQNGGTGITLTVDGSKTFQTIDGFGANLSAYAWNGGKVTGALDTLLNVQGDNLFRVIIETCTGWEDTFNPDPYTNNAVYSTTKFTNLWNEISYLNAHGATVMLNVMGFLPSWFGPNDTITTSNEDAWADMVASMVYYGINTAKVKIDYLSPMNEQDVGNPEGPSVGEFQYVNLMDKLLAKLAAHGLGNVQIVGPDVASATNLTTKYLPQMFGDSTLMSHVNHLTYHSYFGDSTNLDATVKGSGWPGRDWWVTEFAGGLNPSADQGQEIPNEWGYSETGFQYLLSHLAAGASGATVYDGVDAYYEHHGAVNTLGQVAWNQTTDTYSTRKRLYANGQVFKFVTPGMVRVGSSDSSSSIIELAFKDPSTGKVTIVGQNTGSGLVTITGTLTGGLSASAFHVYFTNSNSSVNMQQQADVTVSGNTFSFTVPADTIFTLVSTTGAAGGAALSPLTVLSDPTSSVLDQGLLSSTSLVSESPDLAASGKHWELAIAVGQMPAVAPIPSKDLSNQTALDLLFSSASGAAASNVPVGNVLISPWDFRVGTTVPSSFGQLNPLDDSSGSLFQEIQDPLERPNWV